MIVNKNKALIDENKTLVGENDKLADENDQLADENDTLVVEPYKVAYVNNELIDINTDLSTRLDTCYQKLVKIEAIDKMKQDIRTIITNARNLDTSRYIDVYLKNEYVILNIFGKIGKYRRNNGLDLIKSFQALAELDGGFCTGYSWLKNKLCTDTNDSADCYNQFTYCKQLLADSEILNEILSIQRHQEHIIVLLARLSQNEISDIILKNIQTSKSHGISKLIYGTRTYHVANYEII